MPVMPINSANPIKQSDKSDSPNNLSKSIKNIELDEILYKMSVAHGYNRSLQEFKKEHTSFDYFFLMKKDQEKMIAKTRKKYIYRKKKSSTAVK